MSDPSFLPPSQSVSPGDPAPSTPAIREASRLESSVIALDTQVFYSENFGYDTRHMRELRARVAEGRLTVAMSDVNIREVETGIRRAVAKAFETLGGKVREGTRILRGLGGRYEVLFETPDTSGVEAQLLERFRAFRSEVSLSVVPTDDLPVGPILDRYFATKPPFEGSGEKKSEFPDAISLAGLSRWAQDRNTVVYVVTGDKGAQTAAVDFPFLQPVGSLTELLAREATTYRASQQRRLAERSFESCLEDLRAQITAEFLSLEFDFDDNDYGNVEVGDVSANVVKLSRALLTEVVEGSATFELEAEISYSTDLRFDDPEATYYDHEEGEQHVFNRIHAESSATIRVPVAVTLQLGVTPEDAEILEVAVNEGLSVDIDSSSLIHVGSDLDDQWDDSFQ